MRPRKRGRPPKPKSEVLRAVKVRLDPATLGKLSALSQESGYSTSELIRACVTRALPYVEQKANQSRRDKV